MAEKLESICFFLNTGKTYTFRDVEVIHDNQTAVKIRYAAMSDGLPKEAVFYKEHIAGVARCYSADFKLQPGQIVPAL